MAEITVTPLTFLKDCITQESLQAGHWFFFFFLMTRTFWKTSLANKLVLSCLMWSKFLLGHVTPNSQCDAHFKNTNKPVWGFFFFLSFWTSLWKLWDWSEGQAGDSVFQGYWCESYNLRISGSQGKGDSNIWCMYPNPKLPVSIPGAMKNVWVSSQWGGSSPFLVIIFKIILKPQKSKVLNHE